MSLYVKVWLSILLAAVAGYGGYTGWKIYQATSGAGRTNHEVRRPTTDAPEVPAGQPRVIERTRDVGSLAAMRFVDTRGRAFDMTSLEGQVWVASFFFSACPGPCAQMNRAIAELQSDTQGKDVRFVSITCDPDNDTPERLAEYAGMFHADPKRWHFLSGPMDDVQQLGINIFQVVVQPKEHTERVMLVDRSGKLRGLYLTSNPAHMIAIRKKIDELLAKSPDAASADDAKDAESDERSNSAEAATESTDPAPAVESRTEEPKAEESAESSDATEPNAAAREPAVP